MMMKKSLLSLAVFAAAGVGAAQASDLSYNYVQGSYTETEIDAEGASIDIDGFNLGGSFELGDMFFVTLEAGKASGNDNFLGADVDVDTDSRTIGFGFHTAINDKVDFVASLAKSTVDVTVDVDGFNEFDGDADANLLSVGVRGLASESVELFANAIYVDGDDDSETDLNFGGMYHVSSNFGLGLSFTSADDADATSVFARFTF
ncbi:outer membrane beta-barrel protein [Permianibacter sp. IMCC34836]|uniref:outer membrane beta-barrel protein n=1 Tax=Permianibacter fluminis TaxID=2738515 RepID=UPI0015563BF5|nr:outer membrane beta-barrel protein [Permianibacter fluminis]NQD37130.1 outer membrane beta-barrel protein [Permianibacter fluminis]